MQYKLLIFITLIIQATILSSAASADLSGVISAPLAEMQSGLAQLEANHSDIVENTEKHIRFYAETQQTDFAIVYLHGFSATRMELHPLVDRLADALQANVFYTRLTGHGRSQDAMLDGSVAAWKQDTEEALALAQRLGRKIIVIGTSTGGTLATWLNANISDADAPFATILISPNFAVKSRSSELLQWRLGRWLVKILKGDYYSFTPHNEFHAKYWTERYPIDAIAPMLDLVDEVAEIDKQRITTPHMIVYSPQDHVIDVSKIIEFADALGSEQTVVLPFTQSKDPAQHVLVGDASSPNEVDLLLNAISEFIRAL
ncbi:lysophospholipase [Arenicella chitinivorans]|uniref:Lysophospholipase n=1 Tax=Arenicella chitinivorans TaxID=1329800 RepID=A0A918RMG4_9GAMM|nr:alpha/beta fold hydrolase [Arenicella chitinivorans]GHA00840.1 lysophospholipase [Arenicella chitinivorans]